jgi:DNA-binding NtrC family response regulator
VQRLGDQGVVKVDVRIIAATNHDLAKMVAAGTFREDLYYRLAVIPVHMPPLRERKDDVPLLAQHFLNKFGAALARDREPGMPVPAISVSQEAMRHLMSHGWPGNVRELENALERAVALSGGRRQIEVRDLPPAVQAAGASIAPIDAVIPEEGFDLPGYIDRLERDVIGRALDRTGGNKGAAARLLNLKRTTLVEKLKRMDRASGAGRDETAS